MGKKDIGVYAGTIWSLLSERGKLDIRKIGECTGFKESAIILALGWLARENKIEMLDKNGILYFELIPMYS